MTFLVRVCLSFRRPSRKNVQNVQNTSNGKKRNRKNNINRLCTLYYFITYIFFPSTRNTPAGTRAQTVSTGEPVPCIPEGTAAPRVSSRKAATVVGDAAVASAVTRRTTTGHLARTVSLWGTTIRGCVVVPCLLA